jgi:hypothetical protein
MNKLNLTLVSLNKRMNALEAAHAEANEATSAQFEKIFAYLQANAWRIDGDVVADVINMSIAYSKLEEKESDAFSAMNDLETRIEELS